MSAPIQASASVQVVPASNCVRSRTRMPFSKPGDMGATAIVELLAIIRWDKRPHHSWPSAPDSDQKCAIVGARPRLPVSRASFNDRCRAHRAITPTHLYAWTPQKTDGSEASMLSDERGFGIGFFRRPTIRALSG